MLLKKHFRRLVATLMCLSLTAVSFLAQQEFAGADDAQQIQRERLRLQQERLKQLIAEQQRLVAIQSALKAAQVKKQAEAASADEQILGLMPKQETGALDFLKKYPEYDGKGVVVAIFDTGVDPGAEGLQKTSDGQPKVIDIVDATGSGDVDMSKEVKIEEDKPIVGLTGRTLKLNKKWKIPSGQIRIGRKNGFDLFDHESLVPRIKAERKKKFDETQRKLENSYRAKIATMSGKGKAEMQKRLAQLVAAGRSYNDPGPIYDCVVFHDGKSFRAAVDTDEDGDFNDEKDMTNFRVNQEWDTLDQVSLVNFGVNIYDNGRVLSIVNDCHPHGTHVAGIVAANYPKRPEFNGVAPGAQIVSVRIGDGYLDGMETGKGLIRGVKAVLQNKCDLVNMSFGEPTKTPNRGLIVDYFKELVNKHGVIFISSAGNAGPALSTVGAPGGTTSELIGVGAYVSPKMMAAEYALRTQGAGLGYTWTSRGPTFDGDLGVNLFAPGGAIAPVPQWTLDKSMRMNGTSMASPNCCGNFALALSGLKAKKIGYSPTSVRRAFENTAKVIDSADRYAQGRGLVQVVSAYENLVRDAKKPNEHIPLSVAVSGGRRGIYLRESTEASLHAEPSEFSVRVAPKFHPNASSRQKVAYRMRLKMESTADWVQVGEEITVTNGGSTLNVLVDPRELEFGPNYAEVVGYDADDRSRGAMFRVPVTVCVPLPSMTFNPGLEQLETDGPVLENGHIEERLESEAGSIARRFFQVPAGATWANLRLRIKPHDDGGKQRVFMIHALQTVPGWTNRDGETNTFLRLEPGVPKVHSFPVESGRAIELAIAQYWSSLGACDLDYELTFHGITPDNRQVSLVPGDIATQVEVTTSLQYENLQPSAKLTTVRKLVKPSSAKVTQMPFDRDGFDQGRVFSELVLSYSVEGPGSVTAKFAKTDDLLYDSDFGGVYWSIFTKAGKRVATDDIWADPVRLGKGTHTLKLTIRHTNAGRLNAFKSMPLALESALKSPITLPIYSTIVSARNGGPSFRGKWLAPGNRQRLYIGNVNSVPAGTSPGDALLGTITYGKKEEHNGAGQRAGGFTLTATVPAIGPGSSTASAPKPGKLEDRIKSASRTAKLDHLKSVAGAKTPGYVTSMPQAILDGDKLPGALYDLYELDQTATRKDHLGDVVSAADKVLELLNGEIPKLDKLDSSLDTLLGKNSKLTAAQKKAQWVRDAMADVLYRKGRALGYMELPEVLEKHPIKDKKAHDKQFKDNFAALKKLVDTTSADYFLLHVRNDTREGRYAHALELLNKHAGADPTNYWYMEKRRKLYAKLGWKHLERVQQQSIMAEHPNGRPQ